MILYHREGCTNSVPSCCRLILFVQQPAESISPTHRCINGKSRPFELVLLRCVKLQRAVRSLSVVMTNVDAEDALEVASGEYEQPVQAFRSHGSDPALAHGVGTRRPDGGANHPQMLSRKYLIERPAELGVAVVDEKPERMCSLVEVEGEVPRLLGNQAPSGMMVQPARWTRLVVSSMNTST
jgi:hypothetical protein